MIVIIIEKIGGKMKEKKRKKMKFILYFVNVFGSN